MATVKVRYVGPMSDSDKRTMEVTPDEASRLEATGLWAQVKKAPKPSVKKEASNG